jgi:hypothetical protein
MKPPCFYFSFYTKMALKYCTCFKRTSVAQIFVTLDNTVSPTLGIAQPPSRNLS